MLTEAEFEAVPRTRRPEIRGLPKEELIGVARRVCECRDKARDITRHRRRERRGKAEPRGASPAPSEAGTSMKKLRRANRVRHHLGAGRTASRGMRPRPDGGDTARVDPREIGRVSRAVEAAQARRDR